MPSFHNTEQTYTRNAEWPHRSGVTYTVQAGDVLRYPQGFAFADCLVLGITDDGIARLVRPYAYAHLTGTTTPNPLLGFETIDISVKELAEQGYRVLARGRNT